MPVGIHNIELLTYSEVEAVSGYVGNFTVKIRKKARYVDAKACNSCGECAKVCPVVMPDEFQMGLSSRKAIYIPFPQAVPCSYILNMDDCLGNNPIACGKCADVCDKQAISYDDRDEIVTREVGAVIVAIGLDVYDPTAMDEYGYTRFENVITSMEFERLICAGGPTDGHFVRPSDQEPPEAHRLHPVRRLAQPGDRQPVLLQHLLHEHDQGHAAARGSLPGRRERRSSTRTSGRSGSRSRTCSSAPRRRARATFAACRATSRRTPARGNLLVTVENTTTGKLERHELDMVVLSVGVVPPRTSTRSRRLLTLLDAPPTGSSWRRTRSSSRSTRRRAASIFAGFCESPKDIKDSVCQAGAAASRAGALLNAGHITIEAITSRIDEAACSKCGAAAPRCARTAPSSGRRARSPRWSRRRAPAAAPAAPTCLFGAITMRHFTDEQLIAQVRATLGDNPQEKVFAFACNWCSYAGADTAGISRMQYPASSRVVRTMCSARVSEEMVLEAFRAGAPVVLVSGCHYADCHYINANRQTVKRVQSLWNTLEKAGVRPERLQLEWISAAEGQRFAKVMRQMEELRKTVTAEEIAHAREALKPKPKKTARATASGARDAAMAKGEAAAVAGQASSP